MQSKRDKDLHLPLKATLVNPQGLDEPLALTEESFASFSWNCSSLYRFDQNHSILPPHKKGFIQTLRLTTHTLPFHWSNAWESYL